MFEYLQNPWIGGVITILATSLAVSIANRFPALAKIHNVVLVLIASTVFTFFTTPFSALHTFGDFQVLGLRFLIVLMVAFSVAVTSAQAIVDFLIGRIIDKLKEFLDKFSPPSPPAQA